MTTVVVQAHPVEDSFNGALLERVRGGLEQSGDPFDVFQIARGHRPGVADLNGADRLVLVYPTWWGGQPAMLLAWIQDMLSQPESLADVRRLVAVTSLGSSQLLNRIQGEWGRDNLSRRVLAACCAGATFEWMPFYKIDRQSQTAIDAHLTKIESAFAQD
jgi:NAD(P)H dehydrogenase (quinone)